LFIAGDKVLRNTKTGKDTKTADRFPKNVTGFGKTCDEMTGPCVIPV
jgi:hypothetical protein